MRKLLNAIAALWRSDDCRNCKFLWRNGVYHECDQSGSRAYLQTRVGLVDIDNPYTVAECRAWRAR